MRAGLPARITGILAGLLLAGMGVVGAQEDPSIRGPVTALLLDGQRLLIGQGSTLIEARVTPADLQVIRSRDLGRHAIRAIAISQGITLVLSEDGLTTLDAQGAPLDFAEGGGQTLSAKAGRIYIAAMNAGVHLLKMDAAGKLSRLGTFQTLGPAMDLSPDADAWLWVAESDSGVRLYDTSNPTAPRVLTWLGNLTPATALRLNGTRLVIGYGNHLAVLDTVSIQAPHLLTTIDLEGVNAHAGDLLIQNNRVYVGRVEASSADVIILSLLNPSAPTTRFGDGGAGEHLALSGSDLFIGSGRHGLRRIRFNSAQPELIRSWEPLGTAESCSVAAPMQPEPPNLGEVSNGPVTLTWKSGCNPATFEVRIDGTPVAVTDKPTYSFTPRQGVVTWQVSIIDAAGNRADGPLWTFESAVEGWITAPALAPKAALLYTPPAVLIELRTPGEVLAATCIALGVGLLIIISAAWAIRTIADRRITSPDR